MHYTTHKSSQYVFKAYKHLKGFMIKILPKPKGDLDRVFRFYKEPSGAWYVDLPEWKAAKWHLAMVEGADTLLDSLRDYAKRDVKLTTSLEHFGGCSVLRKTHDEPIGDGAYYEFIDDQGEVLQLWLCGVMTWYYGFNPEKIYFRKVLD